MEVFFEPFGYYDRTKLPETLAKLGKSEPFGYYDVRMVSHNDNYNYSTSKK